MLAACASESPPPSGDEVECAIGAGAELSAVCVLEQVAGSPDVVIHHPDGGFRRFVRDAATGGIVPLDGAEPLVPQASEPGSLQFAVGVDRYRIPSELLSPAPQ
jgi:hypothetical protein